MSKLFGLPINTLLYGLLALSAAGILVLFVSAIRNLVLFKTGIRNIFRHPAQTSLIVLGLMLATLLISAALITGDTMNYSIQKTALEDLGVTDEIIRVKSEKITSGKEFKSGAISKTDTFFENKYYEKVKNAVSSKYSDGISPVISEKVPVAAPRSKRNAPSISVLAVNNNYSQEIAPLETASGKELRISNIKDAETYLNKEAANKLNAKKGDTLKFFMSSKTKQVKVKGIFSKGGKPSDDAVMIMPLSYVQKVLQKKNKINAIIISNKGDEVEGAKYSNKIADEAESALKGSNLEISKVKKEALDDAQDAASSFTSVFLVFGQFSTIAGTMLIFLIFIMLAAARKLELGVLRALGSQRTDILRIFIFEGALYAIIASALGAVAGIGVGWLMVKILAKTFGFSSTKLTFYFSLKSLVIAYTMGVIATFVVVFFSAWRTGHINIVRAIKDIPEPKKRHTSLRTIAGSIGLIILGIILIRTGLIANNEAPFFSGVSLLITGVPLLLRVFRLPDRFAFTIAGCGLLFIWLAPVKVINKVLPWLKGMDSGIEMFFISGMTIVAGAIWIVMYNSDLLMNLVVKILGKLKGLPSMLRIAVNYPMSNRFRTGLVLAMFSLIVFTLIFMSVIVASFAPVFEDVNGLSGGYHIKGITGNNNPIKNINKILDEKGKGIDSDDFEAIGSFSMVPVDIRQAKIKDKTYVRYLLQGIDKGYAKSTNYQIDVRNKKYKTAKDVWKAIVENPNLAVVHTNVVPARTDYNAGEELPDFMFKGFYREDADLSDVYVDVRNPATGKTKKLQVIGIVNDFALYTSAGIFTSQKTINNIMKIEPPKIPSVASGMKLNPRQMMKMKKETAKIEKLSKIYATTFWFKLKPGVNKDRASKALAKTFYENGLEPVVIKKEIADFMLMNTMMNRLIQGFMGLGLIIGIAALGVIAARSVVERRKQIGMLRAIGFRKGMVQNTFILESSFIAILGILIGIFLGTSLSKKAVVIISDGMPGVAFKYPLTEVIMIGLIAYIASLLTTYLPARQAAKVYPAEALRYE